jgi:glycosyltransferase involved in cell wall biosynthesis
MTIFYILIKAVRARADGEKLVVYVRGETVLALIPLTYIVPIFFETHQIRNYEHLYKIALQRVKGIIVITEGLKNKFVEAYGISARKILMARDAVDVTKFQSVTSDKSIWAEHGIAPTKKIVLYSGTLAPEKGVDTLAGAAALVPSDVQIVFLGGTDEQVASFKEKYGQIENISIIGRVDHVMVPKYLASADVFVLPDSSKYTYSNLYTSPMKLFEYMASGHPILASKVPSLLEVLDEETAVFFEPDNHVSLAGVIEDVLKNTEKALHLSENARERVSEFTWEKRTKAIVAHILEQIQ